MTKKIKTVTEETVNDSPREIDDKDRKAERFFNFFKNEENYVISLYKVKDRGKAELIEKYENEVPDLLKIREEWGGGTYKLYAHDFDNVLIDTTVVHVAELPSGGPSVDTEELILQKMVKYRELFGTGSGNNEVMLKVIEMQSQFTQSINQLVSKMNEKNLEAQLAMERRFADMIEKVNSKSNGFEDLIKASEFISMIKGDGGESSLLDKIIGNPLFQNIATNFISTRQHAEIPAPSVPKKITSKNGEIPQEFIDRLTLENKEKGIENVMKAYKIERDRAEIIVDGILRNKGLIQ